MNKTEKRKASQKKYCEEHRDQRNATNRRYREKLKYETLSHYSDGTPVCAHCGFTDMLALSIDHINGGGRQHRRVMHKGTGAWYFWLKAQGYPIGFQVLCMNCQFIKKHTEDMR